MDLIIIAVCALTVTGLACAVMLCAASKALDIPVDERVGKMLEILPGSNCGACGFAGCSGYANALISGGDIQGNLCTPGGNALAKQLGEILGVEAEEVAGKLAVVHCRGDNDALLKKMAYNGIQSCMAAKQIFGGEGACAFGCLGYGDCREHCPVNAICMVKGLAHIISERCIGCGLCVKSCPNKLITISDQHVETVVMCRNIEKGAVARKKCSRSCIGCRKCARECKAGAITVEDNLAVIDYSKCDHCKHCAETCVMDCIQPAVHRPT
jgi:RnfABCDGE-type electron transport complex B subunit